MAKVNVRAVVHDILGGHDDQTILDYVVAVLEDDHFEFGDGGVEAYEQLGPVLVDAGCCSSEDAAKEACRLIAARLDRSASNGKAASSTHRALGSGPVMLAEADQKVLLSTALKSGKDLIQTPFGNLPEISDKDKAKLERRVLRDEQVQRAAFEAHQAQAQRTVAGHRPSIQRNKGGGGSRDVHLENFSVSNGGKDLITDATVTMAWGRRYGLIGRNGTGKSTFLRALESGDIKGLPPNCQVLHVEQEIVGSDTTVLEAVLECDSERSQLLEEEAELLKKLNKDKATFVSAQGAPTQPKAAAGAQPPPTAAPDADLALTTRLVEVYARLEEIDAYGAEAKAASILNGLSFDAPMMQRATKTFSGGWRMRVALARALFVEPDLLLLDEPTNHLDLHAVLWLEEYLIHWPKTVLVVSHAREFLNAVCTDIIHLQGCKLTTYKGDYDTFLRTSRERARNAAKAAESVEMKRAHIQSFIDKFRFNAKRASLVQSRIKALERLADVEQVERDPEYMFSFPDPGAAISPPIISFTDVSFGYPGGPELFHDLDFGLDLESRLAIVGPNGIGKSTLLGLINGSLEPTKGTITRNPKVRMATFSQHHVDGLDLALTPLQVMLKAYPTLKEQEARQHLGSFGVSGPLALQSMYTLSGGQKSRVAFAKLTFEKPHILLLDEPSNHLDIDAVDALIEGLTLFKGGVLMVSHDQYLIESTVDELWMCEEGRVTPFHGTFEEYKKRLRMLEKQRQAAQTAAAQQRSAVAAQAHKEQQQQQHQQQQQ